MKIKDVRTAVQRSTAVLRSLGVTLAIVSVGPSVEAQSVNSGSDGSDGELSLTAAGEVVFDPFETARFGRVLDADGDGVYNFTTITIGSGVTVRLRGDKVNRPLFWLASGDVVINGIIDSRGENGRHPSSIPDLDARRQVAIPGSGGYAGGAAGGLGLPGTPGEGPGGGSGGPPCPASGLSVCGKGGVFTGNRFLVPLVGGSGGEGSVHENPNLFAYGGAAGGGAILIASSTKITVDGLITAAGGNGVGSGSGGAIRLVAPIISGGGTFRVEGGVGGGPETSNGGPGWVRLEGNQLGTGFTFGPASAITRGHPVDPSTLRPASSIRVTAVDGVQVPASPSGTFQLPDVTINKSGPVNVDIQATGIPPGTVVTLQVFPETPTDPSVVNLPTAQAILGGSLQSSTATATFTFPFGFSRGFVRASWTP